MVDQREGLMSTRISRREFIVASAQRTAIAGFTVLAARYSDLTTTVVGFAKPVSPVSLRFR
jgi:hypothetical protein